jgi:hypothetical protein
VRAQLEILTRSTKMNAGLQKVETTKVSFLAEELGCTAIFHFSFFIFH